MVVQLRGIENSLAVPSIIAKEALYRLMHNLVLPKVANKTYEKYFGYKIGDTITVKRPFKARVQEGRKFKKSEMIDKTVQITVNKRFHYGLEAVDETAFFDIEDYSDRYLQAGAEELAYKYDITGAEELANGLFLFNGTPGTAINFVEAQNIRAHATKMAIPRNSNNFALLDPLDIAQISQNIVGPGSAGVAVPAGNGAYTYNTPGIFNNDMTADAVRKMFSGPIAGFETIESVHVPYYEVDGLAGATAPQINGANQRGDTIQTDGWTNLGRRAVKKGTLLQIAGVMEIQPRGDRKVTGNKMTFMVTEDATPNASGQMSIKIYPEINDGTSANTVPNPSGTANDPDTDKATLDASAYQTVDDVAPDNAVITIIGWDTNAKTEDRRYRQGVYFCGDALEYANIQLPLPRSATYCGSSRDPQTGAVITYLADFDGDLMTEMERLDIMFGVKTVYPELGIRHIGARV